MISMQHYTFSLSFTRSQYLPFFESIWAGFPSPAVDSQKHKLCIEEYLVERPLSTICVRMTGDILCEQGIYDGDNILVDTGKKSQTGDIVLAILDGSYVVRPLCHEKKYYLEYEQKESDFEVKGVVIGLFRKI